MKLDISDPQARDDAESCSQGTWPEGMRACDRLRRSPDTDIRNYGIRCGGRSRDSATTCEAQFDGVQPPDGLPLSIPGAGDATASECFDGILPACDELTDTSDKDLAIYGATCAGRQEQLASCVDTYLGKATTSAEELDGALLEKLNVLAAACQGSDLGACDDLARDAAGTPFSHHQQYGATCGHRLSQAVDSCVKPASQTSPPPTATRPPPTTPTRPTTNPPQHRRQPGQPRPRAPNTQQPPRPGRPHRRRSLHGVRR